MSIEWAGLLAILGFYGLFFLVGSLAGRRKGEEFLADEFLLAGRRLPLLVGVLTMTATWVGGGYINGTAEAVADPARGLLWAQAPWGYALSLVVGGLFFAARMRREGYSTLLDVFEARYGKKVAAGLFIPALLGEIFWSSAILVALGTTFGTIIGVSFYWSILISAAVAVAYTVMGGLRSVAYTDSLQIFFIFLGLVVAIFFALDGSVTVGELYRDYARRFGVASDFVPGGQAWSGAQPWGWLWIDSAFLLVLGGVPWQVYFQRVLACRDEKSAVQLSLLAAAGCLLMAVPPVIIGWIGASTDWSQVAGGEIPNTALTLPYVLRYLTPPAVAVLGLAAVAAATMSSVDSSILSAGSMLTWNVLRPFSGGLSGERISLLLKLSVVGVGALAVLLALRVQSVYTLWFLCSDLVYVILFPQLLLALYDRKNRSAGVVAGISLAVVLRAGGGESALGLPMLLPYPWEDGLGGTYFPFRTAAMLANLVVSWSVSRLWAKGIRSSL